MSAKKLEADISYIIKDKYPILGEPCIAEHDDCIGLTWRIPGVWLSADILKNGQVEFFARNDELNRAEVGIWCAGEPLPEEIVWALEGAGIHSNDRVKCASDIMAEAEDLIENDIDTAYDRHRAARQRVRK